MQEVCQIARHWRPPGLRYKVIQREFEGSWGGFDRIVLFLSLISDDCL